MTDPFYCRPVPKRPKETLPGPGKRFRGIFFAFVVVVLLLLAAAIFQGCSGVRKHVEGVSFEEVADICASYKTVVCKGNEQPEECESPEPEDIPSAMECSKGLDAELCSPPRPGYKGLCGLLGRNLVAIERKLKDDE